MARKAPRVPGGTATLADALSASQRKKLDALKERLQRSVSAEVSRQRAQSAPPWRSLPPPSTPRTRQNPEALKSGKPPQPQSARSPAPSVENEDQGFGACIRLAKRKPVKAVRKKPEFELWSLPSVAAVRERPPQSARSDQKAAFEKCCAAGQEALSVQGDDMAVVGFDFGTSCTKLVARRFTDAEVAFCVAAPDHCRNENHPFLWKTVLWIDKQRQFHALPGQDRKPLTTLKQGIAEGRAKELAPDPATALVTPIVAATAYMAMVMRYASGWLVSKQSSIFVARQTRWFFNIGLPALDFDDPVLLSTYRQAAAAALITARLEGPITVDSVEAALGHGVVVNAAGSKEAAEDLGIAIIAETAAGATAFAKSINRTDGLYLMVDVGAMTLDICTFRLLRSDQNQDEYPILSADVRPLGVEAFHWFIADGKTEGGFREQCDQAMRKVVWSTKCNRDPGAEAWKRGHGRLPVFLTGGGARNKLHAEQVEALGPWLNEHTGNHGIRLLSQTRPKEFIVPAELEGAADDFGRLAVAWGLSFPPDAIGKIKPSREIVDVPRSTRLDTSGRYVSKDQV